MQHTAQAGVENMQFTDNKNQHGSPKRKSLKSLLKILDYYLYRNVVYLHYDLWYHADLILYTVENVFFPHFTGKIVAYGLNKGISDTNK